MGRDDTLLALHALDARTVLVERDRDHARLVVAANALDVADARYLLAALGLWEQT